MPYARRTQALLPQAAALPPFSVFQFSNKTTYLPPQNLPRNIHTCNNQPQN
jgi:hypothetical protein